MKFKFISLVLFATLCSCVSQKQESNDECLKGSDAIVFNELESFNPECAVMYRAPKPIKIDGVMSEEEWGDVPYLTDFVDIEGKAEFKPHLATKAKITYDDNYLYVVADMETPHLWADFKKRDDVICLENDFELFVDFSGDTHDYIEFEINALNTVWDLLMTKPYRDGGKCYNMLNLLDYKTAVKVNGTINNPNDIDKGWCVEIALPWAEILEARSGERKPVVGEQFRLNLLRIEYPLDVKDGKYVKAINPKYDKEMGNHWTWSPVGRIDLHSPDLYGYVQVSDKVAGEGSDEFNKKPEESVKWLLRRLYYRQGVYKKATGEYASKSCQLKADELFSSEMLANLKFYTTPSNYEITYNDNGTIWHIVADGKIWSTKEAVN